MQARADIAASFQRVAVEQLAHRLKYAAEWTREVEPEARVLVVAGGVAANQMLRARLDEVAAEAGYQAVYPPPRLCTDNGMQPAQSLRGCCKHKWVQGNRACCECNSHGCVHVQG
jgi:N6-L-threonylcarbamoyladenine synthase